MTKRELELMLINSTKRIQELETQLEKNQNNKCFDEFIVEWLDLKKPKLASTSYRGYHNIIHKHLIPYFSNSILRNISAWDIERYYNLKSLELSDNTIKKHYVILKIIFTKAKYFHLIDQNIMKLVDPVKYIKSQIDYYNINDLLLLFKVMKKTKFYIVVLLCSLGLRRSEALAIKWEDIDFETRYLKVRAKICSDTNNYSEILKTSTSYRQIVIPQYMIKEFKSLNFFSNCDFVCENNHKTHLSNYAVSNGLSYYVKKHKLKHITLKGLRHTCATLISRNGYNLNFIKDWLGHSTIKLTADTYSHVDMTDKNNIADDFDELFNK